MCMYINKYVIYIYVCVYIWLVLENVLSSIDMCTCVNIPIYIFIWWRWGFLFSLCNLKTRSPKERGPGPVRGFKIISFSVSFSLSCSAICREHGSRSLSCHMAIKWPQELMTSVFLARKRKDRVGGRRQKNTFLLNLPLLRIIL